MIEARLWYETKLILSGESLLPWHHISREETRSKSLFLSDLRLAQQNSAVEIEAI